MNDTPIPPALANDTTDLPAPRPKRPWTILGRLSKAVREQNWFAVILELAIVVLGVVIGFQVTGWGQERADRAQEQTYLRQLARDLAETERQAEDLRQTMAPLTLAPRRLAQAYYLPEPPPRDSVINWGVDAVAWYDVSPVLGTAEALVATGDIGLIRDDSLRSAITAYLDEAREDIRGWVVFRDLHVELTSDYVLHAPYDLMLAESVDPAAMDSLDRAGDSRALVPPGVPLPPLDTDALVRDERIHSLMVMLYTTKNNMGWYGRKIRRDAAALRVHVEAELNR